MKLLMTEPKETLDKLREMSKELTYFANLQASARTLMEWYEVKDAMDEILKRAGRRLNLVEPKYLEFRVNVRHVMPPPACSSAANVWRRPSFATASGMMYPEKGDRLMRGPESFTTVDRKKV
jgi:hypothetical protein